MQAEDPMDFLKIIRSLEELLYEAMTWLIFYPRSLWRAMVHPVELMRYADAEMGDAFDEQFTDLLSPPLCLMISILIAHGLELGLHLKMTANSTTMSYLTGTTENLLIFRAIIFSLFPLMMACALLRRQTTPIDRNSLRRPFYVQCFITSPYVILASGAIALARVPTPAMHQAGAVVGIVATAWYLAIEARWFRLQLPVGWARATWLAVSNYLLALAAIIATAVLLALL
jgi:hypothetical protein